MSLIRTQFCKIVEPNDILQNQMQHSGGHMMKMWLLSSVRDSSSSQGKLPFLASVWRGRKSCLLPLSYPLFPSSDFASYFSQSTATIPTPYHWRPRPYLHLFHPIPIAHGPRYLPSCAPHPQEADLRLSLLSLQLLPLILPM